MEDLIKALQILKKYLIDDYNQEYPFSCEHDILYVCGIDMDAMTVEDVRELYKLGFIPGSDEDSEITAIYDEDGNYCGDIDFSEISQEDWDNMKFEITNCFRSYRYGSC